MTVLRRETLRADRPHGRRGGVLWAARAGCWSGQAIGRDRPGPDTPTSVSLKGQVHRPDGAGLSSAELFGMVSPFISAPGSAAPSTGHQDLAADDRYCGGGVRRQWSYRPHRRGVHRPRSERVAIVGRALGRPGSASPRRCLRLPGAGRVRRVWPGQLGSG